MSSRLITDALSCRLSSGTLSTMQSPKLVTHTKQFSECWPPAVVNCATPTRRTRAPSDFLGQTLPADPGRKKQDIDTYALTGMLNGDRLGRLVSVS